MIKNLLTRTLLMLTFLTAFTGFSQVVTLVDLQQVGTITPGQTANFTLTYKTDGAVDATGGTQRLYLPGSGAVSPGFAAITYTATSGANATMNLSFTWPASFTSSGTYNWRFFQPGGSNFDWSPLTTDHNPAPITYGGPTFEPATDYLGISPVVTITTLSTTEFEQDNKISLYVSEGQLNVSKASEYKIYNLLGAVVLEGKASEVIDVNSLSNGLYIYKSAQGGTAKFVKN